jgi:SAM-dependent methyltransferase
MTATSYSNDFFDLVVHSDVLEHVPDHMKGLQECYRILKKDGYLIFTTPFFGIQLTVVRAVLQDNGNILHLRPASYHGDPLNPAGILAYYDFGWSLYEDLTKTGFTDVTICVNYDPFSGFVSNNHPCPNISEKDNDYGDMLPLVFVCRK